MSQCNRPRSRDIRSVNEERRLRRESNVSSSSDRQARLSAVRLKESVPAASTPHTPDVRPAAQRSTDLQLSSQPSQN